MAQQYAKVKDNPDLVRDLNSKAILATNLEERNRVIQERERQRKIDKIIENDENTQKELSEIKELLQKLLGK